MKGCLFRGAIAPVFIIIIFFAGFQHVVAQKVYQPAVMDLQSADFSIEDDYELNSQWRFYWQELIPPSAFDTVVQQPSKLVDFPHLWNEDPELSSYGYATYQLKVILPETHPSLALSIPDLYTAYSLYINGHLISQNGVVAETEQDYTPYWLPKTVSINQFQSNELNLVMHVSNFKHSKGGSRLPILIGNERFLQRQRTIELEYVLLLGGAAFMIGLFFLGLYGFGKHERPILYFAFFCLIYTYRLIGTELYPLHHLIFSLPWIVTLKAEYISLYLAPAIFGLFIKNLYPEETNLKILYPFIGLFCAFTLITLFSTAYYFTQLINLFFYTIPFVIVFISWTCIKATINKREGSRFALASIIAVSFVFIYNLLEYYVLVKEILIIDFLGYFSFFFLQSLILSYRFTNSLNRSRVKAEEAARIKSQFLSTMSHEIRTPLNAVIGLSELLIKSDSEKEKTEFARSIKDSGENLLEIINNILDYSKYESTRIEINDHPVQIRQLVEKVLHLLKPLTSGKDISLSYHFEEDIPEWIRTDETRIKQVLINLVGNAIKFTNSGSIRIRIYNNPNLDKEGNLLFEIKDTGTGIPIDKTDRLFKSFSQIDSSSTRQHGGTGLGLVISKKIVEAMGGSIWFESQPDKGTTFFFTIKTSKTDPDKSLIGSSDKISSLEKKLPQDFKVLLVEDNAMNQTVALSILKKIGFTADIAQNGVEAVNMHKNNNYHLIFMDMEMPIMDGVEATKLIRKFEQSSQEKTIIIAMTANAFREDKEKCLTAGMNDFISKPVSISVLQQMIEKWTLNNTDR